MSFLKKGQPITELEYIMQEFGLTPDPKMFLSIRDFLVACEDLEKVEANYFGRTQFKYFAKRKPNIDVFEKDEIVLINDVIESISNINATEISDYTHQFISWIFASQKERLPFYTFLLTNAEPETKHLEWANNIIKSEINNA